MVEEEHGRTTHEQAMPAEAGLPHIEPGPAVEFALLPGQRLELSVSAGGVISLRVAADEILSPPDLLQSSELQEVTDPEQQAPVVDSPAESDAATPLVAEATPRQINNAGTAGAERQPRGTFRGVVSTHPRLEATPRGVPKAVFRLAVHPDEDTTTHLSCVAFDNQRKQLAQQVYERVHKGDAVEVVGYRQERQRRGQDGQMRTVVEVYVAAVRHQQEISPPPNHHQPA